MLYIAFCVPQIGVGGPKYFSVPKIGFGVKNDYKAKNEYVFIFNRRGANNNNNNNNNNGRFPEGVQKEEIQHGGRSAHGQELRRPTTLCCGNKKITNNNPTVDPNTKTRLACMAHNIQKQK